MRFLILLFFLIPPSACLSQDQLYLRDGRVIEYSKIIQFEDHIEVKSTVENKYVEFPNELVVAYHQVAKEKSFFLKEDFGAEDDYSHIFLKRLHVGHVSVYKKPYGRPDLYLEKNNRIRRIPTGRLTNEEQQELMKLIVSFFEDDDESVAYLESADFWISEKEILKLAILYNERNFLNRMPSSDDITGEVYLYRTKFQKTKEGLKIKMHEDYHDLYIDDFIILNLPIEFPSLLNVYDKNVSSSKVLHGTFEDQYYEVLYDKRTDAFKFDAKEGTELQFELHGITDRVNKRMSDKKE